MKNMSYIGKATPTKDGSYDIEIHEPSPSVMGWVIKLGTAAAIGAVTYIGQYLGAKAMEAYEKSQNKKKKKNNK